MAKVAQLNCTTGSRKSSILITSDSDPQDLVQQAARALASAPHRVFSRDGRLVRARTDGGRARVEELDEAGLLGLLVETVRFVQWGRGGHPRVVEPPRWLVRTLLSAPPPIFPELRGVVHHPIVRPDGSIRTREGYDPETRFWCHLGTLDIPPVPRHPTDDDLTQARDVLDDLCCDFPFADEASRANAWALLLTPLVRTAFEGPTPLFLIDKPSPGTGATLLARLVALVACGEEAVTPPPEDDAEARKLITAALLTAQEVVIFDDVAALRLCTLSRLLTATHWESRLLGSNRLARLPNSAVWVATGNNVSLGADLARRVVWIRLDAKHWRPWEREGFLHPELLSYVRKERGRIIWALLTLVRHYFVRGCLQATVPTMGGFENWAYLVGGVLAACGIEGFLKNRERLYEEADQQLAGWPEFLRALQELRTDPFTARWLSDEIARNDHLRGAVPESLESFTPRALSEALRRRAGMRFAPDGLRVERAGRGREGVLWQVVVDSPTDLRELANQLLGPEVGDGDYEALERAALREA
jgi:putative DNA primase/helicase